MAETIPIPGPAPWPLVGNLPSIDRQNSLRSLAEHADQYGPIYKMILGGVERIFITGPELVNEVCTRKDFVKIPVGVLKQQQLVVPEGLFTADHGEEHWEIAHRVLVPAFGPLSIRGMFSEMYDIIAQLALKWARHGSDTPIDVTAEFTRLTLDTIALCAMDVRFNSFYSEEAHPFGSAMNGSFYESQLRAVQPSWLQAMLWKANERFDNYRNTLHSVAMEMIAKRRANPTEKKDLVNSMLKGRDPVTGKGLSDNSIRDNMITFLTAGHETTAGLLSFTFAYLMLNPDKYKKLQEEVDSVLGTDPMTADHVNRLPYTKASLREALRLQPPVGGFTLNSIDHDPVLLGGKWAIPPGTTVTILLHNLHRNTDVWGDNPDDFEPERMMEDRMKKLPPNVFKPFGNGMRACIGTEFAMQESIMTLALMMQKFDFKLKDPNYEMKVKQTATIRPWDLFMHATPRPGVDAMSLQRDLFHASSMFNSTSSTLRSGDEGTKVGPEEDGEMHPMSIFYGSNTGTCEGLAGRLAVFARQRGFECSIEPLNKAIDRIPKDRPIIIISSSHYEGLPPDNASKFMPWLNELDNGSLDGTQYAIFGCGNVEWKETFQAVPIQLQDKFEEKGAKPLATRGVADAGEGNVIGDFDRWQLDHLWPGVLKVYGSDETKNAANAISEADLVPSGGQLSATTDKTALGQIVAKVREVKALTSDEDRPKYHLVVDLPENTTYEVGDYLDVYPRNSEEDVQKLLSIVHRCGLDESDPTVWTLSYRHELGQPASPRQIEILINACASEELQHLKCLQRSLRDMPAVSWPSVLHILTAYPGVSISAKDLVTLLPPLRPRPYSISSSPLASPTRCSLTWSLLRREAIATRPADEGSHVPGLASHYLAGLKPGATLKCAVRSGHSRFRPPEDITTPVVMVCAGAGIAPFAGFVAHRAEQVRRNPAIKETMGKMVLFVGCRSKHHRVYASELEGSGVVDVRYAYSRGGSRDGFSGHVQDRLWDEREELVSLWDQGAKMFVCGSRAVSLGCKEVVRKLYREVAAKRCGEKTEAEVDEWWIEILKERYAVDVF